MSQTTITVEALKSRRSEYVKGKAELVSRHAKLRDDIVATAGAIDALDKLIADLESVKEPAPKKSDPKK